MISRRFLIGAMAAVPAAAALAPLVPARAAGIGEKPGDMAVGAPDAPVTVIEFFSLTCPSCERFHKQVYNRLKPEYVDAGRVRFVVRDFPLNAPAFEAAVLAHCAGRERYFTFIDVLFQTFDDWASSRDFNDKLGQIGELGGVSRDQFADCLADQGLENSIFQSIADGQAEYDVSGTPTLVVNGEKYDGQMSFDALSKHIDRLLAGS
ncbi:MAG: DsbA family protein [Rhodospirillaceae bacterium]|nr:DsbA family protein [Rhodospirillaceae bacterium]